jgi:hypothetical protein
MIMPIPEAEYMGGPEIEEFGKLLVHEVRDTAIRSCDQNLHVDANDVISQRWKRLDPFTNLESVAHALIPDVIDDTIFQLLRAIDGEELRLSFTSSDGNTVDLLKDGSRELAGWHASIPGLRSMYSKERYFDDFAHLPNPGDEEMANPKLKEFARLLMKEVRDEAIRACDTRFHPGAGGRTARRWKNLDPKTGLESIASTLIQDAVDDTVFQLLRAIDGGDLELSFTTSHGKKINLFEDGLHELAGWYIGIPGWRSAYSTERYIDDFADVQLPEDLR